MEGIGLVTTSSPTSSVTGRPWASHAWRSVPRQAAWSSPTWTGRVGTPPAKQLHTSVPPLTEAIHRSRATSSCSQRKPSGGSGEPVVATQPTADRSRSRPGWMPALRQAMTYAAEVPKTVVPVCSATRHCAATSG